MKTTSRLATLGTIRRKLAAANVRPKCIIPKERSFDVEFGCEEAFQAFLSQAMDPDFMRGLEGFAIAGHQIGVDAHGYEYQANSYALYA